jgi:asparagine synthetase B (glutamine-hydrolysing)
MPRLRLIEPLPTGFAWDGNRLLEPSSLLHRDPDDGEVRGAFSIAISGNEELSLARDPLGLGKLFFAEDGEELIVAARLSGLSRAGICLEDCWAFPTGIAAHWEPGEPVPVVLSLEGGPAPLFDPDETPKAIRRSLESYIEAIATARQHCDRRHPEAPTPRCAGSLPRPRRKRW